MKKKENTVQNPTKAERFMQKRLEDSRIASAAYESTLDPRQRVDLSWEGE